MALTATTLTTTTTKTSDVIVVGSTTSMTASSVATGGGPTFLLIDDELMQVLQVISSTAVRVQRAMNETFAAVHSANRGVLWGPVIDLQMTGPFLKYPVTNEHNIAGPMGTQTYPSTLTTAGALTYTAGNLQNVFIFRDPNGASRTDTLPTAALLVAALPFPILGYTFEFYVRNDADAAETITIAAGTGGTVTGGGTMTVAQSAIKKFGIRITSTVSGSESYIVYSLGTSVF